MLTYYNYCNHECNSIYSDYCVDRCINMCKMKIHNCIDDMSMNYESVIPNGLFFTILLILLVGWLLNQIHTHITNKHIKYILYIMLTILCYFVSQLIYVSFA
jgi:hypothetical protein